MSFFERLYTYRQKEGKHERENFLTELLAGILRTNPVLLQAFIRWAGLSVEQADMPEVRTQVHHPEGIPDLVISTTDGKLLLLVECKLEAKEGTEQLKRYEAILARCAAPQSAVVFLTKYYEPPSAGAVRYLRWHQLYAMSKQAAGDGLLTEFQQYLAFHNLHHPMSFTPTDLLVLENIAATTRKMDEVLSSLETLFREVTGSYNQTSRTRSGKLNGGWYGMSHKFLGITLDVGFWSYQGETAVCFYIVETDKAIRAVGDFQHALRTTWGLPDVQDPAYLELAVPIIRFMSGDGEGSDVTAMRKWFEDRIIELKHLLAVHPLT